MNKQYKKEIYIFFFNEPGVFITSLCMFFNYYSFNKYHTIGKMESARPESQRAFE